MVFHAPRIEKWSLSVVAECGRGLTFPAWLFCNPRHWQAAAPSPFRELLLVTRSKTPPGHTPSGKAFDRCFQISMAYLCRPGRHSVCRMFWGWTPFGHKGTNLTASVIRLSSSPQTAHLPQSLWALPLKIFFSNWEIIEVITENSDHRFTIEVVEQLVSWICCQSTCWTNSRTSDQHLQQKGRNQKPLSLSSCSLKFRQFVACLWFSTVQAFIFCLAKTCKKQPATKTRSPRVLTLCQRVKSLIKVLCGEYPFYTAQAQVYHLVVDQRRKDLLHGLGDRRKDHDTKSKSIDRNRSDRGSVLQVLPVFFPKKVKNDQKWFQPLKPGFLP